MSVHADVINIGAGGYQMIGGLDLKSVNLALDWEWVDFDYIWIKRLLLSGVFGQYLSNCLSLTLMQYMDSKLLAVALYWCSYLRDWVSFLQEIS